MAQQRLGEFRFQRYKLPPDAFLIGPKREPEPTDLIDKETWGGITTLPDDVSLRTSEHHGTLLKNAHQLWGHWIALVLDLQTLTPNPRDDALALSCLDTSDDFQASIYTVLTGFYRQSIATLRMALEEVLAGAYFRALPDPVKERQWAEGHREGQLWVREMREALGAIEPYSRFERNDDTIFAQRGWVNFLYSRLSGFNHGRPYHTDEEGHQLPTSNVGLWGGSNGPVYERRAVDLWSAFFFDTALLCLLLVSLAEARLLTFGNPSDISFREFLRRVLSWHHGPRPVACEVIQLLGV